MNKSIFLIPAIAALVACATTPVPLKGEFSTITPATSIAGGQSGEQVRWGGEIIRVTPDSAETCFEILSRELDASARPQKRDNSDGRFIACRAGFYDPEVFTKGRELTVTGRLNGTAIGKVGQFDYTYPKLAADTIYLWPKRPLIIEQRNTWPYDPFWGPRYGPWWGGGFWGGPPIVIIKPHSPPSDGGGKR